MNTVLSSKAQSLPSLLIGTSVGKKILMALTGFVAFGYVAGHMLGNLQIFLGQDRLNAYAEALHSLGPLLWVIRIFLLAAFAAHIWLGTVLKLENMAARPVSYAKPITVQATFASRTMIITGLTILAFFVYHILHFTARVTNPDFANLTDGHGRYDVYSMVIMGFRNGYISTFYLIAVGFLCYHLSHGIASMFQSIGLNGQRCETPLKRLGTAISIIFFVGYASVPTAILLGLVKLPGEAM